MPDRLELEGLSVAPNVIETIVRIATEQTEGVAYVGGIPLSGPAALLKAKMPSVEISRSDDGCLLVCVYLTAIYGSVLPELGERVQAAIADALGTQLSIERVYVDVYVEALEFKTCA